MLSSHIWELKDRGLTEGLDFRVKWEILDRATIYNPVSKKCLLCLKENYFIMYTRGNSSLNKRSEVYNTCRHRTQSLLSKVKWRGYLFYLIINFLFQFSFWYRNRNNISSDVRKFVIPEDCNYVVLVIWNKLVESQLFCNKVISKVCIIEFRYHFIPKQLNRN